MFQDYVEAVWVAQNRRDQLEARIAAMLPSWSMAPLVEALRTLRGLDLISAVTFITAPSARRAEVRNLLLEKGQEEVGPVRFFKGPLQPQRR